MFEFSVCLSWFILACFIVIIIEQKFKNLKAESPFSWYESPNEILGKPLKNGLLIRPPSR